MESRQPTLRTGGALHGFLAILRKEFTIIFRDPTTLFFMFFPPLVQLLAFGLALDNDVKHMAMLVLDRDRTVESREFVQSMEGTRTFRFAGEVTTREELERKMRQGKAYIGIEIPRNFTENLRAGRNAQIQAVIDGSNSTTALQALNTAMSVAFQRSLRIVLPEAGRDSLPVEVRPQVLYNPAMRSPNFFVPGVMGVALQIATVFATALSVVRERERGTIEQLLVSPLSAGGFMLGKLVPYLCISMTMACCLFAVSRFVFQIPIAGSVGALLLGAALYIFALLSMGLFISTRAGNQMQAFQMSLTTILPSVFFSGFLFPRETMPWIFRMISNVLPATYFIDLNRAIMLRGATLGEFAGHYIIMAGIGIFFFLICARIFSKQIGG